MSDNYILGDILLPYDYIFHVISLSDILIVNYQNFNYDSLDSDLYRSLV